MHMNVNMYLKISFYKCMHIYMHICMYICIYIFFYIDMHLFTYIPTFICTYKYINKQFFYVPYLCKYILFRMQFCVYFFMSTCHQNKHAYTNTYVFIYCSRFMHFLKQVKHAHLCMPI